MKKYSRLSSAAVMIAALRVKLLWIGVHCLVVNRADLNIRYLTAASEEDYLGESNFLSWSWSLNMQNIGKDNKWAETYPLKLWKLL